MRLILGSASPRRRELLSQIGVVPDQITPADINEDAAPRERPLAYVKRIASQKAAALEIGAGDLVLCADTIVHLGTRILGKPADQDTAAGFLKLLSGRRHKVTTAIVLRSSTQLWQRQVQTVVRFKQLSDQELQNYLQSGEWQGKAGGYAIQGLGAAMIPSINGSYTNVVGLPLAETANLLRAAGYPVLLDGPAA